MVLLPGCACCGCSYPYIDSRPYSGDYVSSVEVVCESSGQDAYWSYGVRTPNAFCVCQPLSGGYITTRGSASYKPANGVFSLSGYPSGSSHILSFQSANIVLQIELFFQGSTRFVLQGSTILGVNTVGTYPPGQDERFCAQLYDLSHFSYGTRHLYGFSLQQTCNDLQYSATAILPVSHSTLVDYQPLVVNTPSTQNPVLQFGFFTYTDIQQIASDTSSVDSYYGTACGTPAVVTYGPSFGVPGQGYSAPFAISSIKVFYNNGTFMELLP